MKFRDVRTDVLATCRTLADRGFLAGTGGNIAMRADQQHFAVTPSGTDYYTMTASDICVLRLADLKQVDGELAPSVESGLHARLLIARTDCNASVHTHQPIASAYTLLAQSLEVDSPALRELIGAVIPCSGYAPSGTSWLAKKVAKLARPDVHAYLMRTHGVVCLGKDFHEAVQRVEALETACSDFFRKQIKARGSRLPPSVLEAVESTLK